MAEKKREGKGDTLRFLERNLKAAEIRCLLANTDKKLDEAYRRKCAAEKMLAIVKAWG